MTENSQSPARRPFLTANWLDLIMLNWEVEPSLLTAFVPRGTELDSFRGKYYLSVVAFRFENTRLLGLPVPYHTHFEELNLRFYVRRETAAELKRGVVFIKELVPRVAIATLARWLYNENYVATPMSHSITDSAQQRLIEYSWLQNRRWQNLSVSCQSQAEATQADSLEEYIAEHYWGYTRQRDGGTVEYQVTHPRWNVWQPAEISFDADIAALYGASFNTVVTRPASFSLVAEGSPVTVSFPVRIA